MAIFLLSCQLPITITNIQASISTITPAVLAPVVSLTPFQPAASGQLTDTPTVDSIATDTITSTLTLTVTPTITGTATITQTGTITPFTPTSSSTVTSTATSTRIPSLTLSPTRTLTFLYSPTKTNTRTMTRTYTATIPTLTRTITKTPLPSATPAPPNSTRTASPTANQTLVQPQGPVTPMQLINAMNQLRVANGFPALIVNPILMGTAQWTAEYMAANHLLGHIGDVRGRVAAAGYGSGATVYATENWAMGFSTLDQIMVAWSDAAHMYPATMYYYVDIGAGVATGPWGPYYVLHAAYSIGTTNTPTMTRSPVPTDTLTPTPTSTPTNTPIPPSPTSAICSANTDSSFEFQLVDLINQQRINAGLSTLAWQDQLASAARGHSLDMACNNIFSHTGSDGSSPFDRILAQGYSYSYAGETIYGGNGSYNSPQAAIDTWMNSQGHRDIILTGTYTSIGIGYEFNPSSDYGGYFTAVFASP
jgi:uncharacterized protein YkwD